MKETIYPEKTEAEIRAACIAQRDKCNTEKFPHFAPADGRCYACRHNIYQNYGASKGHSGIDFITGCPHCHESFCE